MREFQTPYRGDADVQRRPLRLSSYVTAPRIAIIIAQLPIVSSI
jgi:hypothetical protein